MKAFNRKHLSGDECRNCDRPESEHVWRCADCGETHEKDEKGFPIDLHETHGQGYATLCCPEGA